MKRIHFIAIGGSVMHNLALCLNELGHNVSGSDDIIYDPAKSRLEKAGILPSKVGWDADRITEQVDLIILGMHAKKDNPELLKALELNIPIVSFPEYVGKHAEDKLNVVVAGSHGKTTTTSMIMHALRQKEKPFDYLVGAQLKGFDLMVKLSDAPIMVIEGDEYLSSPLDSSPKFLHYNPSICLLTGLDWDHINVFPTYEAYLKAFNDLLQSMENNATLIYNAYDPDVERYVQGLDLSCKVVPYYQANWELINDVWSIQFQDGSDWEWDLTGHHNIINAMGAMQALIQMGWNQNDVLKAFASFELPDKRLNLLSDSEDLTIFRDFAHAPSKVKASVSSMKTYANQRNFIAVIELHTYSSLNKDFLPHYDGALASADHAFLYYNPKNLTIKRLEAIDASYIKDSFSAPDLKVFTDADELGKAVQSKLSGNDLLLLMSSSNFGGIDWLKLGE